MARSRTTLTAHVPVERVFDFVSDFRNAPLWDPQAASVEKLGDAPIGLGTRFVMRASLLGRTFDLPYEIVAFERPRRLVVEGATRLLRYRDEITLHADDAGECRTRLDYDAELELRPAPRFLDRAIQLGFAQVARIATRGMARAIELHAVPRT